MKGLSIYARGIAAVLLLLSGAACRDQLPTAVDEDLFPGGIRAATYVLEVPADEVVEEIGRFTGYTSPLTAGFLLAAHQFDGTLQANTVARLTGFPDSVTYTVNGASHTDSVFVYGSGQVMAVIDTAASTTGAAVQFQLWTLTETWDLASVSWEAAVDTGGVTTPWQQPGGSRGRLLAEATWAPGDTVLHDSIAFAIDSLTVQEMATEGFPGILVTASSPDTRMQFSRLLLRTSVRPEGRPDTAIVQTISGGPQTFLFTPEAPEPLGVWQTGGVRSARTLFRVDLARRFPCPAVTGRPPCVTAGDSLRLADVTLNQAALLLEPLPVGSGFRPLVPFTLSLRTVAEPELGRRAPLGERVAQASAEPQLFTAAGGSDVVLDLTAYISLRAVADSVVNLAILAEPEGTRFGLAHFSAAPRLRLVYTFPLTPVRP